MTLNVNDKSQLRDEVVKYVQGYYKRHGRVPSIKEICRHCKTYYKRLKDVFPQGLADICAASGVPVPSERLKWVEKALRKRMMKAAKQREAKGEAEEPRVVESPVLMRHSLLLDALIQTFLESLAALHLSEASSSGVGDIADNAARKLLERIGEVDLDYLRKILETSEYLNFIESYGILDFSRREEEIEESQVARRRAWVELLKRHHPELLADYLT